VYFFRPTSSHHRQTTSFCVFFQLVLHCVTQYGLKIKTHASHERCPIISSLLGPDAPSSLCTKTCSISVPPRRKLSFLQGVEAGFWCQPTIRIQSVLSSREKRPQRETHHVQIVAKLITSGTKHPLPHTAYSTQ